MEHLPSFALGLFLGVFVGVATMAVLSINRDESTQDDDQEPELSTRDF